MNKRQRRDVLLKARYPGRPTREEKDAALKEGWKRFKKTRPDEITPEMHLKATELGWENES